MNQKIGELITSIKVLEEELEAELGKRRDEFHFIVEQKRIRFAEEIIQVQKRFKTGIIRYMIEAHPLNIITAPVIYAGFLPFLFLDLFVTLYQTACFPVYGIPKVTRGDYMIFDRTDLPYLNPIEKFNCFYCSYANGVAAYTREIAARTEQYWCPVKHARRIIAAHSRYGRFFEFGDAESFGRGLEKLRRDFEKQDAG
jgi:hypothetical protein